MGRNTRGWLIGIGIALVVSAGLYFGISAIIQNQETGQQNAQLQATPVSGVTQIYMNNFAFGPANIKIPIGTTITWTNQDDAEHTVTFNNGMADSGLFGKGKTYHYTFSTAGVFTYHCAVHPAMIGRVTVTP